ncbi:MAG: hypothetical protein ACLF0G_13955 [Candidatus Brocadiia bacterium]
MHTPACGAALLLVLLGLARGAEGEGRIAPSPGNPRYWAYKGRTALLLGGSDEDNLFNDPELMGRNLEALQEAGGNYIRCTLSCRDEGNVWPFARIGDAYDLDRPNAEFWTRLHRCIRECARRDIIVQIEIWATFDYYRDNWRRNPFNPANNRNYTTENTRLETEWNHHPHAKPQPFFHSPPKLNDDRVLLGHQQAFVRKVLDVALDAPNVLYCLDNETKAPAEWAHYWARFLHDEARRRGTAIQLTEMWDWWDLRERGHARTYAHPQLFAFTDVSQNNWNQGQTHYDRFLWYRAGLLEHGGPRPMNCVKIYGAPRPRRPRDTALNVDRFWKCVFAGCASARFHRPPTGIGLDADARAAIRAARAFTDAFDLFAAEPHNDLLSERSDDEAYCLAEPGAAYALYFPAGGAVRLAAAPARRWRVRGFDPRTARFTPSRPAEGGSLLVECPDAKLPWLVLVQPDEP